MTRGLIAVAAVFAIAAACGTQTKPRAKPTESVIKGADDSSGQLAVASRGVSHGADGGVDEAESPDEKEKTRYSDYKFKPPTTKRAGSGRMYESGYNARITGDTGAVRGRVDARDALGKRAAGTDCAGKRVERLGQRPAVVYISGIKTGRPHFGDYSMSDGLVTGGLLERHRCQFFPQLQIVAPASVTVAARWRQRDAGQIVLKQLGSALDLHKFEFTASGDQRRLTMQGPAFIEARTEPDKDASRAHLVIVGHPYYTMTDERGHFVIDELPPGQYELVLWYPPVSRGIVNGKPSVRPAIVQRHKIVIRTGQVTKRSFRVTTR